MRNVIFPRMGHLFDVFMGENIGKFKERVMKRQRILLLIWKEYLVLTYLYNSRMFVIGYFSSRKLDSNVFVRSGKDSLGFPL